MNILQGARDANFDGCSAAIQEGADINYLYVSKCVGNHSGKFRVYIVIMSGEPAYALRRLIDAPVCSARDYSLVIDRKSVV